MGTFKKFLVVTEKFENFIMQWSTIAFTAIVFAAVITRYFFNYSWAPTEEVVKFIRIWVAFIGMAYATRYGLHINMSVIYDLLPDGGKKALAILLSTVGFAASVLLTLYGYQMVMGAYHGDHVSSALRLPIAPIYLAVPIGSFLMAIQYARTLVKNFREKGPHISPDKQEEVEAV